MQFKLLLGVAMVGAVLTCADQSITVTPNSVVSFGAGDAFGLEQLSRDALYVLLRPLGEDCNLRFPLKIGETLFLRGTAKDGKPLLCEASLSSVVEGSSARFLYRCSVQPHSIGRKCPP